MDLRRRDCWRLKDRILSRMRATRGTMLLLQQAEASRTTGKWHPADRRHQDLGATDILEAMELPKVASNHLLHHRRARRVPPQLWESQLMLRHLVQWVHPLQLLLRFQLTQAGRCTQQQGCVLLCHHHLSTRNSTILLCNLRQLSTKALMNNPRN